MDFISIKFGRIYILARRIGRVGVRSFAAAAKYGFRVMFRIVRTAGAM